MKSSLDIKETMTNRMNNDEIVDFYKLNCRFLRITAYFLTIFFCNNNYCIV